MYLCSKKVKSGNKSARTIKRYSQRAFETADPPKGQRLSRLAVIIPPEMFPNSKRSYPGCGISVKQTPNRKTPVAAISKQSFYKSRTNSRVAPLSVGGKWNPLNITSPASLGPAQTSYSARLNTNKITRTAVSTDDKAASLDGEQSWLVWILPRYQPAEDPLIPSDVLSASLRAEDSLIRQPSSPPSSAHAHIHPSIHTSIHSQF